MAHEDTGNSLFDAIPWRFQDDHNGVRQYINVDSITGGDVVRYFKFDLVAGVTYTFQTRKDVWSGSDDTERLSLFSNLGSLLVTETFNQGIDGPGTLIITFLATVSEIHRIAVFVDGNDPAFQTLDINPRPFLQNVQSLQHFQSRVNVEFETFEVPLLQKVKAATNIRFDSNKDPVEKIINAKWLVNVMVKKIVNMRFDCLQFIRKLINMRYRSFTKPRFRLFARNVVTDVITLIAETNDLSPQVLSDVALADGSYEIEVRTFKDYWESSRSKILFSLSISGGVIEFSGVPFIQNLSSEILRNFTTRISWSISDEYALGDISHGVWRSATSPVDVSGPPDFTIPNITGKGDYSIVIQQTAPEFVAVATFTDTDQATESEIFLNWDTVAPDSPSDQFGNE